MIGTLDLASFAWGVLLALGFAVWWEARFAAGRKRVLFACDFTEWRYGRDLRKQANVGRGAIYVHLEALERNRFVESRTDGTGRFLYRRLR